MRDGRDANVRSNTPWACWGQHEPSHPLSITPSLRRAFLSRFPPPLKLILSSHDFIDVSSSASPARAAANGDDPVCDDDPMKPRGPRNRAPDRGQRVGLARALSKLGFCSRRKHGI